VIYIYQLFAQSYLKRGRKVALFALCENLFQEEIMSININNETVVANLRKEVVRLHEERDELRKEVSKLQDKISDRDLIILMMYNELDETAKDLEILGRVNMCLNVMLAVKTDGKG